MRRVRKETEVKSGEYVLCTKYRDRSTQDQWQVGFLDYVEDRGLGNMFFYMKDPQRSYFTCCWKITKEEGDLILESKDPKAADKRRMKMTDKKKVVKRVVEKRDPKKKKTEKAKTKYWLVVLGESEFLKFSSDEELKKWLGDEEINLEASNELGLLLFTTPPIFPYVETSLTLKFQ